MLAFLLSTVDGLDTPLEVDTKIANALLGLATKTFVAAQLASRDASITSLQEAMGSLSSGIETPSKDRDTEAGFPGETLH